MRTRTRAAFQPRDYRVRIGLALALCMLLGSLSASARRVREPYMVIEDGPLPVPISNPGVTAKLGQRVPLFQEHKTQFITLMKTPLHGELLVPFNKVNEKGKAVGWVTQEKELVFAGAAQSVDGTFYLQEGEVLQIRRLKGKEFFVNVERLGRKATVSIPEKSDHIKVRWKEYWQLVAREKKARAAREKKMQEEQARQEREEQARIEAAQRRMEEAERRRQQEVQEEARAAREKELERQRQEEARLEQERLLKLEEERQAQLAAERRKKEEEAERARLEKERQLALERERKARLEEERRLKEAEAERLRIEKEKQIELERVRKEKLEEQRRLEQIEEEKARIERERQLQLEREKKARIEEERRLKEAELEQARLELLKQEKLAEIEQARLELAKQEKLAEVEKARIEAEKKLKLELEEQARLERERKRQEELAEQARLELLKQKQEAELEKARIEAQQQLKLELEEKARIERERQRQQEIEERKRLEREKAELERKQEAIRRAREAEEKRRAEEALRKRERFQQQEAEARKQQQESQSRLARAQTNSRRSQHAADLRFGLAFSKAGVSIPEGLARWAAEQQRQDEEQRKKAMELARIEKEKEQQQIELELRKEQARLERAQQVRKEQERQRRLEELKKQQRIEERRQEIAAQARRERLLQLSREAETRIHNAKEHEKTATDSFEERPTDTKWPPMYEKAMASIMTAPRLATTPTTGEETTLFDSRGLTITIFLLLAVPLAVTIIMLRHAQRRRVPSEISVSGSPEDLAYVSEMVAEMIKETESKAFGDQTRENADMSGSLQGFSVTDLVQFLNGSRESGVLTIKSDDHPDVGTLQFREGEIIHAQRDALLGDDAFYAIVSATEGAFAFHRGIDDGIETNIGQNTMSMLMEAARLMDENSNTNEDTDAPGDDLADGDIFNRAV